MTTHLTKIWWDLNKHKLVEQAIPEAEIYKREWVGLTEAERIDIIDDEITAPSTEHFALAQTIEAKLKEKNS